MNQTNLAFAESSYSQDDLRFDTATPIVDYPETILNKKINFTQKIDMSMYRINLTDELFYNNTSYAIKAGYHYTDFFSAGIMFQNLSQQLNEYSEIFKNSNGQLDFSRAPVPERSYFLYLEQLYFYGKISLKPNLVLTNNFLGRYSLGIMQYSTKDFLPQFNYSLGFQTYVSKYLFFELGYGISIQQVYNPVSLNIRSTQPVPEKTSFSKKIQFSQNLNIGLGFLF